MIILRDIKDAEKFICWESKTHKHEIVSDYSGGQRFVAGCYVEDIQERTICRHCGTEFVIKPDVVPAGYEDYISGKDPLDPRD